MLIRKLSLTWKMLLLTAVVSLVIWAVTDSIQTRSLKTIFHQELSERFSLQAEEQRVRFDRYVKGHHQVVKLFANSNALQRYIRNPGWGRHKQIKVHRSPPPWLPRLSVMRNFLQPRCVLLLDANGRVHEAYTTSSKKEPEELLHPSEMLLSLTRNQGFLTSLDNKPYLIASHSVDDTKGRTRAILMLASPLDEQFLSASQGPSISYTGVIALLGETDPVIMVSSNQALIPPGTHLDDLKDRYLVVGQGFFDYGATDIVIKLVSFISTEKVGQLTHEVLGAERHLRSISVLVFIIAFVLLMYLVTRRIQRLSTRVVDFSQTMELKQPIVQAGDQIAELEERFHKLANAVRSETAELEHQALHDPLTDLPNRKLLHNRLQHELLRGQRNNQPLVLILSDLDRFKEINDTLGHHMGDLVLQQAAQRLFHIFRRTDTVARLGGDEFGILLPDTGVEEAQLLAKKVVQEFQQPFIAEGHKLSVGISQGLAEYPLHGDDVNILIQRADIAMYQAKRMSSGYAVYNPSDDVHSIKRLALMTDLRNAINDRELTLYYQPKAELRSGKLVGVEALLRWDHPERGLIPPDDFIPLAEQTGLLKPLTAWVLESAFRQCVEWSKRGLMLPTAVNISVHNLYDSMIQNTISRLVNEHQVATDCLMLEITESDIMVDPIRARETLVRLNEMGVHLSVDDFGTGYSSLSYLKQLPAEELKIDRSFIMEMCEDDNDAVIVRATIDMAHSLGLRVVAEGVENESIWQKLSLMGCDIAQGYFISEPVSAEMLTAWIEQEQWPPQNLSKGLRLV
jgi:diguanylate cyclase (GGDEF)-like protein